MSSFLKTKLDAPWVTALKKLIDKQIVPEVINPNPISDRYLYILELKGQDFVAGSHVVSIPGDNNSWSISSFSGVQLVKLDEVKGAQSQTPSSRSSMLKTKRRHQYQMSYTLQQGKRVGTLTVTIEIQFDKNCDKEDRTCIKDLKFETTVKEAGGEEEEVKSSTTASQAYSSFPGGPVHDDAVPASVASGSTPMSDQGTSTSRLEATEPPTDVNTTANSGEESISSTLASTFEQVRREGNGT